MPPRWRVNPHAETRQPLYWWLSGLQGRSGRARKISLAFESIFILRHVSAFATYSTNVKVKVAPYNRPRWPTESKQRHSSTLSLTTALDGWSTVRPGRFNPHAETRQPLYWRLGGPQGRSGCARKISPLATRIPPADRSSVTIPTELSLHNDVLDKAFLNSEASDVWISSDRRT